MSTTRHFRVAACLGLALLVSAGCREATAPVPQTWGTIAVNVSTTFEAASQGDPLITSNTYYVGIDGAMTLVIAFNGRIRVDQVPFGTHSVKLYGLPYNCSVTGDNPVSVDLGPDDLAGSATFSMSCTAPVQNGGWDY